MPHKLVFLLLTVALTFTAVAGCGGGGQADEAVPPAAEAESSAAHATEASRTETQTAPTTEVTVAVADSSFGPVLVDGEGMTLYVYTEDKDGKIACLDEPAAYVPNGDPNDIFPCTEPWPALLTEGEPVAGDGVDASLLGTVERPDGGTQVTYNGHPLYRSSFDFGPGSTFGKGAWGQWFLVTVAGEPQTVTTEG